MYRKKIEKKLRFRCYINLAKKIRISKNIHILAETINVYYAVKRIAIM